MTRSIPGQLRLAATVVSSVLVSCSLSYQVAATEGANQHYPIGANTAQPAIMPPLGGTAWLNYDQFYVANDFDNADGHSSKPGYHLFTFGEAARLIHTWNVNWDGWHASSQVIVTLLDVNLKVGGVKHSKTGLGDLNIVPLYLSKDFGSVHLLTGFNVWVPSGDYNKKNVVNTGLNYYTFAPDFAVSYHPNPRFAANVDTLVLFNTENPDTNYHSGTAITVDYQVGYRPFDSLQALQLGFSGYYFQQLTDDTKNGISVAPNDLDGEGGNRGRVFAIGPQIRYDVPFGGIIFKWQKELAVQDRPEGDRFWAQFAMKF